jgi:hypothetical protein
MNVDDPAVLTRAAVAVLARARPYRGCLLIGRRNAYPIIKVGDRSDAAHRVVFRAMFGPPPEDRPWVLHRCVGRRNCVNPSCLYAGTPADNSRDQVAAGRSLRGRRHPKVRLTTRQVRRARVAYRRGVPVRVIAARLGVARSTVTSLVSGKNWAWLT